MQSEDALLLQALHRDELRLGSGCGGADRRCVSRVVLLATLNKRLDRLGGNQLHLEAETDQHTRPVVCRTAGLHDHGAAWLLLEEGDQLVARQLAFELDLALRVDAMEMKDRLGGVEPDHANAHRGRLPFAGCDDRILAHRCRWGPSIPSEHDAAWVACQGCRQTTRGEPRGRVRSSMARSVRQSGGITGRAQGGADRLEKTAAPQIFVRACQPVWQPDRTGTKLLATYLGNRSGGSSRRLRQRRDRRNAVPPPLLLVPS